MAAGLIDAHIHLDQFDPAGLPERIRTWRSAGVGAVVAAATDLASSQRTLELARRHPGFVFACGGYHPENPAPDWAAADAVIRFAAAHADDIVALGEVGLPWYRLDEARDREALVSAHLEILRRFCRAARRLGKPLVLHAVHDMAAHALAILKAEGVASAMFHWLKAPPAVVDAVWQAGFFVSLTPEVVSRERDQMIARSVPLSQLLLETDGPWPFAGQPGEPPLLFAAAAAVDRIKGLAETAATATAANARRLFGLDSAGAARGGFPTQ